MIGKQKKEAYDPNEHLEIIFHGRAFTHLLWSNISQNSYWNFNFISRTLENFQKCGFCKKRKNLFFWQKLGHFSWSSFYAKMISDPKLRRHLWKPNQNFWKARYLWCTEKFYDWLIKWGFPKGVMKMKMMKMVDSDLASLSLFDITNRFKTRNIFKWREIQIRTLS